MKAKVKLDKDALLGGLIAHGEKIAFGVFILMFVLLCVGALKQSPYDKTPDKFTGEVKRVDAAVQNATFDPAKELANLPKVVEIKTSEIPATKYPPFRICEVQAQGGSQRRGEPKFLTVHDLHAGTEYGAVEMKAAAQANVQPGMQQNRQAAAAGIQGKQWAVITALVPSPQQVKEYRNTFANAPQGKRDIPRWRSFEVQRQEGEGPWAPLKLQTADAARGVEVATEPETPEYRNLTLIKEVCESPPKLIGKPHDHSIVHPKTAELAVERAANPAVPRPTPIMNSPNQGAPVLTAGAARAQDAAPEHTTEQMFRFFDYTVQPGKSYRYKVRLVLENPNYDLQRYMVKDGEMIKGVTRASDWSEASPVVNVPPASSILAGPVERARGSTQDTMAQVIVRLWEPATAVDALKFGRIWRGHMVNYMEDVPVIPPGSGKVETQTVHFKTNLVVVDMTGGESLPVHRGRSPGRMLVMGPSGELEVKSELEDLDSFENELDRVAELNKPADPPPPPPKNNDDGKDGKKDRDRRGDRKRN